MSRARRAAKAEEATLERYNSKQDKEFEDFFTSELGESLAEFQLAADRAAGRMIR